MPRYLMEADLRMKGGTGLGDFPVREEATPVAVFVLRRLTLLQQRRHTRA